MGNYPDKVKAVRCHEIDDLRIDTIGVPELKSDEILVKNMCGGICGTDRHAWHHGQFIDKDGPNYPAILGHECSSKVIEIGKDVKSDAVGDPIEEGDMVIYQDILGCGKCVFCRAGNPNVCPNMLVAAQKPGVFVQYYTYPSRLFVKVENITPVQGAFVEPASVALHGIRRTGIDGGDTVLIIGAGPIGLFRVQHARNLGAEKVIVSEPEGFNRKLAKNLGADIVIDPIEENVVQRVKDETDGYGADVVFEDVGTPELQLVAIDAVRPHGTVWITGISTTPVSINFTDKVMLYEVTIRGSNGYSTWHEKIHDNQVVANMMKTGRLKTEPLISGEYSIEEGLEAFEVSDDPKNNIKVILKLTP